MPNDNYDTHTFNHEWHQWGSAEPIPKERLQSLEDGTEIAINAVLVSGQQPTFEQNKIWIQDGAEQEFDIPTTADLATIIASNYWPDVDYTIGDYVIKDNKFWRCVVDVPSTGEAWNPEHWEQVRLGNDIAGIFTGARNLTPNMVNNASHVLQTVNFGVDQRDWFPETFRAQARRNIDALNPDSLGSKYWPDTNYKVGQYVVVDGDLYRCTTEIFAPGEEWNPLHWTKVNLATSTYNLEETTKFLNGTITPEKYGAVGDGVADDTDALLSAFYDAYTYKKPVILSPGKTYLTTRELQIYSRIYILGNGATIKAGGSTFGNIFYIESDDNLFPNDQGKFVMEKLTIDCAGIANTAVAVGRSRGMEFRDIDVCNFKVAGFAINDGFEVFMDNVRIAGTIHDDTPYDPSSPTTGIIMSASDSHFINVVIINTGIGINVRGAANMFTHIHYYNTNNNIVPTSIMFEVHRGITCENIYVDTAATAFKIDHNLGEGYTVANIPVMISGISILHGGSGNGGHMTPVIMGDVVATVFDISTAADATRIKCNNMVYIMSDETHPEQYKLFNIDTAGYGAIYPWTTMNDTSIQAMENVPSNLRLNADGTYTIMGV